MTRIVAEKLTCSVCGAKSEQRVLCSLSEGGSPDLDGRPSDIGHAALDSWIQECPACGHCAPDLSRGYPSSPAVVRSAGYQSRLHSEGSPAFVNRFLCAAMLDQTAGKGAAEANSRLLAAWAAEEVGNEALARECRSACADLLLGRRELLRRWMADTADGKGAHWVFLADVLRRAGRFDEALREVDGALGAGPSTIMTQVLLFQRTAISSGDAGRHSINEAVGNARLRLMPYELKDPLLEYLLRHYRDLLSESEQKAATVGRIQTADGEKWATDDRESLSLLARGREALAANLEARLLAEHPGKVVINRCPKCGGVARTPQAKQCRFCQHTWREVK
ncbi:hypothetical protein [Pyxidicoccus trucidator]|uniref:hypothetical protein n=1 Tax=Pyxidicoccus trucidator TaxID=2709662 RepID=UPI0013DC35B9|nr:hypothetical protein [Pyxidicoccus trucidator]